MLISAFDLAVAPCWSGEDVPGSDQHCRHDSSSGNGIWYEDRAGAAEDPDSAECEPLCGQGNAFVVIPEAEWLAAPGVGEEPVFQAWGAALETEERQDHEDRARQAWQDVAGDAEPCEC